MADAMNGDFLFVWKVENFLSWYYDCNNDESVLGSPEFIEVNPMKSSRRLKLSFYELEEDPDIVGISGILLTIPKEAEGKRVFYETSIILSNGEILAVHKREVSLSRTRFILAYFSRNKLSLALDDYTDDSLIVYCRLAEDKEMKSKQITIQEAKTTIGVQRCSFYWNVMFCKCSNWTETKICPHFDVCPIYFTLTYLDDTIRIKIQFPGLKGQFPQVVRCKITLLDVNGIEKKHCKVTHTFKSDNLWEFDSPIMKSYIINNKDLILKNEAFSLLCYVSISNGQKSSEIMEYKHKIKLKSNSMSEIDSINILQEDLKYMLMSKKYSDVKFCVDNDTILAHKSILVARSPVFAAMFEGDMTEVQTGIVELIDVDKNTFEIFLEFLYTGKKDALDCESTLKLLKVADRYNVPSLVEDCTLTLISILNVENVCAVIYIASMIEHQGLKNASTDFIRRHSEIITSSSDWIGICESNPKLAIEILTKLSL